MMNLKYGVLRSLMIIFVMCARNEVQCNKLDSKRRLPSRRRGPRPSSDQYGNERSLDDYRGSSDDNREFIGDDSRSYSSGNQGSLQERDYDENGFDDESTPITSMPEDLVQQYTSKMSSAIVVSICSGICSSVLISLLMKMVMNKIYKVLVLAVSLTCAASCFSKNKGNADVTDFSNALGVFFLLLLKKSRPKSFISQFATQSKAAMLLSSRKQFPASDNPWQHVYEPEDRDAVDFKMWHALIGVVLLGTVSGWSVSAYVPLLPGWFGALGGASFLGYLGTLKDSRGDILRFVGHSMDQYFSYLVSISNDVLLWDKATVLSSRMFSIILRFEKKHKVIERLRFYFTKIIFALTSFFKSVRSDINADTPGTRD